MTQIKSPGKSPNPLPIPLAMSAARPSATASAPSAATPSPIPHPEPPPPTIPISPPAMSSPPGPRPHPKPTHPTPKLRLEIRDLSHPGTAAFLAATSPATILTTASATAQRLLYPDGRAPMPPVRSITLVLRAMSGVAYTIGTELDAAHKEIHVSLDYVARTGARARDEVAGVLVHEVVHVWQWAAGEGVPGGLIEGVADWVRLRAGLAAPHWQRRRKERWDAGYEHTGYFLEWVEGRFGAGSVVRINAALREEGYAEEAFWKGLFGESVHVLWAEYQKTLPDGAEHRAVGKEEAEKEAKPKE